EEIMFRGFLFRGWVSAAPKAWPGILGVSVLFAIVHLQYDWFGITQIFLIGLIVAWARWQSGSIVLTMAMHALINLWATLETVAKVDWLSLVSAQPASAWLLIARRNPWLDRARSHRISREMPYAVAVDIGGTFTDLVAYDTDRHRVAYAKSPTTYGNLVDGVLDCFAKAKLDPHPASLVNHRPTLVINALIKRKGAKAALVTTKGFRDVLEIARGNRPDPFDLHYRRDEPLIPRQLRFEVAERIGSAGEIVTPLDVAALGALAENLKGLGIEAVAVFFMNSYANPAHEEKAAEILRAHLPDAYVTYSTEVTREWYEYERTSTVAANAYVGPQVTTYIKHLASDLAARGFAGSLYMMGSNGGLLSVERSCRQPVGLVESGPIGGCIGAGAY